MSTQHFTARFAAVLALAVALTFVAAACTGGDEVDSDAVTEIRPLLVNSELVVGENRLMVGLLSQDNEEIAAAEVSFRFFKLDGEQQELREEAAATPITVEKNYTHTHDDGTVETHGAGESGVYVATVQFDEAGQWGVETAVTIGDTDYDALGTQFTVLEESISIAVGASAPRSETLTLDDVDDVAEIDTSDPPIPEMHTMTIAEAVTSGRPSVIVFATPAFCLSRICGPTKDAVDDLFGEYKDEVNFVHVEPYELDKARAGEGLFPIPATDEWGLLSEPWVFLVNSQGNVAAKFEAFVTVDDLTGAIEPLLTG